MCNECTLNGLDPHGHVDEHFRIGLDFGVDRPWEKKFQMTIMLCDVGTPPGIDSRQPASWQLADIFSNWLPPPIEAKLRQLNQRWPVDGLYPQIEKREVTRGQWMLYVGACLHGQVLNGGLEQFVFNCPGLMRDARTLTRLIGLAELATGYEEASRGALELLDRFAASGLWLEGEALEPLWAAYEGVELDEDETHYFDAMFMWEEVPVPKHGADFAASLVKACLEHPEEFVATV